jgi:hypothetical protein
MTRIQRAATVALCVSTIAICIGGCSAPASKAVLETSESAVQLRSFQSRAFDTTDKEKTLRTIIATLQDLGFVVDKADATLGSVSATKLSGYDLRMTVTVRPKGTTQLIVRANAQYQDKAVEEPKPYQDFFAALEKSMFLAAQQVE